MYEELLNAFKKEVGFVDHQIAAFNEFVDFRIQKIINEIGEIELETPETAEFRIKLGKVRLGKPSIKEADGAVREITPAEARIRNLTYAAPLFVEVIPVLNGVEQEVKEIKIGEIPIMVKSKACVLNGLDRKQLIELGEDPDDPGGYFIINGTERVIVMVEEILSNRPIIEEKSGVQTARINSEVKGYVQRHLLERKNGIIQISYSNLKKLPVIVLLRALGMETDKQIIDAICNEKDEIEEIYFNIYEFGVNSVDDAIDFIGKMLRVPQPEYRKKRVEDMLDKYLLPHLGQEPSDRMKKAFYLAKVCEKLLKLGLKKVEQQDIDHYMNKRLKMNSDFLEILFRSILLGRYGLVARIIYTYQKLAKRGKLPSIQSIVESNYLTKRIISHMATGQWIGGRTGVCQRLERTDYIRTIAHLRNVLSPLSSAQEHFEARALHPTQWGRLCAEETPEGINIGLRKYLALMAVISETSPKKDVDTVINLVKPYIEEGDYAVYVNGEILGSTNRPKSLVNAVREKRRMGLFDPHISISMDENFNEIRINTDSGRLERPLIVLENGKPRLNEKHIEKLKKGELRWSDLLKQGIIEYLDADEEDNMYVALRPEDITKEHTHLEIDPSVILGISANLVPFPQHNRGDRVNFGAKMSGQALGLYSTNFLSRTDTKSDVLVYPQLPLVRTKVTEEINLAEHPQGQNIVIALMSYAGYNMEDGIVMNQASIERGLGRSIFFRTYSTEEKQYWGIQKDEIKIPDKSVRGYRTEESYVNLSEDGIVNPETFVESGDVLIGKVSPLRFFGPVESFMMETENRRETSETIRHGEQGIVDKVLLTETIDGNKLVKVSVREQRIPELGDKFASRHGQKGVISLIVPEYEMPFTRRGLTPDIIINPHAIPSRMTVGQILEVISAKIAAYTGEPFDATAFKNIREEDLEKVLLKLGFRPDGKQVLYNGVTGEKMEALIFMGPVFYQKLHHMVANKIHSRARGPVTLLTKQPTEGRAKEGGLRLGEMEKDCLIAHGAALLLQERFSSDKATIPICKNCGLVAIYDRVKGKKYCPVCKKSEIIDVDMSYAFKLMLDEMKSLCLYPKINVK
ncbi:MAG: DNA-directed RNA polymerase subunit B [Candidatus Aenigmatarchaeota archaeon]|nr:MAG: DNA-directed RNA polymerase subunit B [Candidatus Aenigmarchaeota archaeon]